MSYIKRVREEQLCYVYFDGAQAEARIVGWTAPIPKWIEQYESARLNPGTYDAHCALASEMFNIPYDDVPKNDWDDATNTHTIRYVAKRCRHGLNYRMQPPRLAQTLSISLREAERLWHLYHKATPELQQWWEAVLERVKRDRVLTTIFGRRMPFMGSKLDEKLLDSIIAFEPQSTLGDFVTSVQYLAPEDDAWPMYARIPFNNHDSLTAMCRPKDVQKVGRVLKRHAERPLMYPAGPLIIPADLKVSYADETGMHRWSNMKKLKLEEYV